MPIQLIIFITKTKIFACEINSNGKAETISIKGNTEIKCEGKESADELIACIFDRFNIDDFADDNFDIVIIESDADREVIKYLEMKCGGATKFNIFSMEKILPVIASGKYLIKVGEEITVAFAEQFYKIACDKNAIIKITLGNQDKKIVLLNPDDFAIIFNYRSVINNDDNYKKIAKYEKDIEEYKQTVSVLSQKINDLQKELQDAQKSLTKLINVKNVVERKSSENKSADATKELNRILKRHKKKFESTPECEGEFYIKGSIPWDVLCFDEDETILAVYCLSKGAKKDELQYLSISVDGINYKANMIGESGFVRWRDIKKIEREEVFSKNYISLCLRNGRQLRLCGVNDSLSDFLFYVLSYVSKFVPYKLPYKS